ncbi:RND family transporter [Mycobacterium shigaense]|uniref:MMPL/RND family transporter n=1 Tax=Mycobacterium shigaense TaxID=722731 RepID=UPI000CFF2A16|nr:RND family transporter [Mycobacterium shigaense]MEA1122304.1 RND family transporter [Mycobacterium shigaense]
MRTQFANDAPPHAHNERPFLARVIHRFSLPIIVGWAGFVIFLGATLPPLEVVGAQRAVSLSPNDASSFKAMRHIGRVFNEGSSDSTAMIVLEGDKPLSDDAHEFYDNMIRKLRADTKHVQHVQDWWGDPLTAAGALSNDGKAVIVQVNLTGNQGEALANESVEAVRKIVDSQRPPPGVKVWLTGASALADDTRAAGDKSTATITIVSAAVVCVMLLLVYRSIFTVILLLLTVGIEMAAARGAVAALGETGAIGLTTFAISLITSLTIAAGTDYGIFVVGRYQEARQAGQDKETAWYTMYRGTAHVILGSGLTIAGAMFCLHFARMPSFHTLGIPCAAGLLMAIAVALTLGPALVAFGSRFGLFEPRRKLQFRGWRRIGTAIARWPAPILVATLAVALVGLLTLPGYHPSYNDRAYLPDWIPANQGFDAADRHFSPARMKPEILMIETDHDMRDPADFLVLNKVAKALIDVPGISRVQAITRPDGTPLAHTTLPFFMSMVQAFQGQDLKFQKKRMEDLLTQAEDLGKMVVIMGRMHSLLVELNGLTHQMTGVTHEIEDKTDELRDHIADFEDFFRPLRSYFYWEKHCYDIPICFSIRSVFDALDSIDEITEKLRDLVASLDKLDTLVPQLAAQLPPQIAIMQGMQNMMLTMHSTMSGIFSQMDSETDNSTAMGRAFDDSKNDDSFYLPPDVFKNKDFKRAEDSFLSADGHAARFIILHRDDPATEAGMKSVDALQTAAEEALKVTPLEDAKIYMYGTAAVFKDFSAGAKWDLLIAGVSSLCLVFVIMLVLTRALAAAAVIVGTVALSLGASFGLSVLVWQYLFSTPLHWLVLAMSVIVLLAVGSDYNLLLVSRFREEIHAGLNTGIIRAMGGTGKVVTNAGLVFAFTMASMIVGDLVIIAQVGTTIGLGLMFDTLIVRAFMTPSIAALLGRWFWWPLRVRTRPASTLLRSMGPRPWVRALVHSE